MSFIHSVYRQKTGFSKLTPRSELCTFIGYDTNSRSYRLLRHSDMKVIKSLMVNCKFPSKEFTLVKNHMSRQPTNLPAKRVSFQSQNQYEILDDDESFYTAEESGDYNNSSDSSDSDKSDIGDSTDSEISDIPGQSVLGDQTLALPGMLAGSSGPNGNVISSILLTPSNFDYVLSLLNCQMFSKIPQMDVCHCRTNPSILLRGILMVLQFPLLVVQDPKSGNIQQMQLS